MELYFKLKFVGFIFSLTVSVILFIILLCAYIMAVIKAKRVEKFFLSHGYKRELLGVPRFGNGSFYGWVRKSDHKTADDRDIKNLSFSEIKKRYE